MGITNSNFEHNLAAESVKLFSVHEEHIHNLLSGKNKEIDGLVGKMEDLESFLTLIANKTDSSNRLNLDSPEDQKFVDKLRNQGLEHAFPHGKYTWKDKEIENLTRTLNQHIEGPLQRRITMLSEEIVLEQHELNKALEIFKSGLTRMNNLIDRIQGNIQKAR